MRHRSSRCHPNRLAFASALAIAAWSSSAALHAEPPGAPPAAEAKKPKESKEELKQAREKAREAAHDAKEAVVAAKEEAKAKIEAAKDEAKAKIEAAKTEMGAKMAEAKEDLRADMHAGVDKMLGAKEGGEAGRMERARERRRMAMHAFHAHVKRPAEIPPQVREAMRRHARRSARLARIRALAEEAKDTKSVARCDKLIALEQAHHDAFMAHLWKKHDEAHPMAAAKGEAPGAPPAAQPAPAAQKEAEEDEKSPEEKTAEDHP